MRYLLGCKILVLFLLNVSTSSAQGINNKNYNFLEYAYKPYYLGIGLGVNTSAFDVNHSKLFTEDKEVGINQSFFQPGLTFQGIFNLKLGQYFDFRTLFGFTLSERTLKFHRPGDTQPYETSKIELVQVDIPFLFRYKSAPYKDKRAFVISGIKYTYDVNAFSRSRQAEDYVTITQHDFAFEVGAGMQFFFPYFILSPEIKMSQGIGNILSYNNSLRESKIIDSLRSRTFTLTFHFEG